VCDARLKYKKDIPEARPESEMLFVGHWIGKNQASDFLDRIAYTERHDDAPGDSPDGFVFDLVGANRVRALQRLLQSIG
jgi:hypothetical protein